MLSNVLVKIEIILEFGSKKDSIVSYGENLPDVRVPLFVSEQARRRQIS